jgi:exodeoxyribonuclease VII small subunit
MMSARSDGVATPIETMSFEAALQELEHIVTRLEQGEVDLEDSINLYERGQALKAHCEKKLKSAESRLEKIVAGARGAERFEPLDMADEGEGPGRAEKCRNPVRGCAGQSHG